MIRLPKFILGAIGALAPSLGSGAASAAPSAPVERPIEAAGPKGPLKGTLLTPAGADARTPVVLIIPGSGPTDRDGDNPLGVKGGSYRQIAEGLAERGVSSVRIDKRGMFASAGAIADPNAVTIADYAADTREWIGSILKATGARCVWLLGHSEGGLIALASTTRAGPELCGLVLAAAPGRKLGDVMREQFKRNPANAPILEPALSAIDALEAGKSVPVTDLPFPLDRIFNPAIQPFLTSLMSYDPPALARAYSGPILVLHGENDIQITAEDAQALASARPGVRRVEFKGLNHLFRPSGSSPQETQASYGDPFGKVPPEVPQAIVDFLRARP